MNCLLVSTSTLQYTKNKSDTNCGYDQTPRIRVPGEKLYIVYQFIRTLSSYMDTTGSLPCSEDLDTGSYFILNQINPAQISAQCLFFIRFNIVFPFFPKICMWLFRSHYQAQIPPSPFCFVCYICYISETNGYSSNGVNVGI